MKASIFNVAQPYKGNCLLYNTYTTSMVEMNEEMYEEIFLGKETKHKIIEEELYKMGFMVDDNCNELTEQENFRKSVIENGSSKISNIIIAPTMECNAHCYYCFEKGFRTGKMSDETADALVGYLAHHWNGSRLGITWFGGEPLLAVDIIDKIVEGMNKAGIVFSSKVITNGSVMDQNALIHMKRWNVDKVQVTIDAIGNDYEKIKNYEGMKEPFSVVMRNVKLALDEGFKMKIRINFDPDKKERALEAMDFFNTNFISYPNLKFYFSPIDEDEHVVKSISNSFPQEKEHPYISLIKYGRKHGLYRGFPDMEDDNSENGKFDEHGLLKKLKIYPSPTNCYATCPGVYSIDCRGKIYKCHRVLGREEFSSGDIFNGIQENETYHYFCNTNLMYEECKKCSILPICQGGCKINAKLFMGKEACAPSKAIIKELILLYKEDLEHMEGGGKNEGD